MLRTFSLVPALLGVLLLAACVSVPDIPPVDELRSNLAKVEAGVTVAEAAIDGAAAIGVISAEQRTAARERTADVRRYLEQARRLLELGDRTGALDFINRAQQLTREVRPPGRN